jgi:hypothetical protein
VLLIEKDPPQLLLDALPPCFLLISASSSRISSVPSPHPSSDETPTTHKASEPASLKQAPIPSQSFFVASTPHNSRISGRSVSRRGTAYLPIPHHLLSQLQLLCNTLSAIAQNQPPSIWNSPYSTQSQHSTSTAYECTALRLPIEGNAIQSSDRCYRGHRYHGHGL